MPKPLSGIIAWSSLPRPCRTKPRFVRRAGGKYILRNLLSRYLPTELYDRPKTGFTPPWEDWCKGAVRDELVNDWEKLPPELFQSDALDFLAPADGSANPLLSWCPIRRCSSLINETTPDERIRQNIFWLILAASLIMRCVLIRSGDCSLIPTNFGITGRLTFCTT